MGFAWKFGFWFVSWTSIIIVGFLSPRFVNLGIFSYFILALGFFLIFYGLLLNSIAGRTLKKYGHMHLGKGMRRPDKLVKEGIYSCMRHPAQFGSILFGIGISLLTLKIIAILYAGWVSLFALYFIINIEERETLQAFGQEYCQFIKNKKPFTFSLKCLKKGVEAIR